MTKHRTTTAAGLMAIGAGGLVPAWGAGTAAELPEDPRLLTKQTTAAGLVPRIGGEVFLNPRTGELVYRTPTPHATRSPGDMDDDGFDDVWVSADLDVCQPGLQASFADVATDWVLDQIPIDTSSSIGTSLLFFGDVNFDAAVGAVSFAYWTDAPEFDTDGDGFADTSDGFGIAMGFYDGDTLRGLDGTFDEVAGRRLVGGFSVQELPGNDRGAGFLSLWIVTIDLASLTFDSDSDGVPDGDFTFELGDTDGMTQATFANAFIGSDTGDYYGGAFNGDGRPDTDIDGDGLHDFSYSVGVNHPLSSGGSNTGIIPGGPVADIGVRPDRPDWRDDFHNVFVNIAPLPNAQGWDPEFTALFGIAPDTATPGIIDGEPVEYGLGYSAFDPVNDTNNNGIPGGPIFDDRDGSTIFGFNCDLRAQYLAANGGNPSYDLGPGPEPMLNQMYLSLGGIQVEPGCLVVDLDNSGTQNFADVQLFIQAFNAQSAAADIDGNGTINFADTQVFIGLFNACR